MAEIGLNGAPNRSNESAIPLLATVTAGSPAPAARPTHNRRLSPGLSTSLGRRAEPPLAFSLDIASFDGGSPDMAITATNTSLGRFHQTAGAQRADELVRALFRAVNAEDDAQIDELVARSFLSYDLQGT